MRLRILIAMLCISGAALIYAPFAVAHRLDEYLQASRISVDPGRVSIEIDLTPGAAVAGSIIASIDADNDGEISPSEGEAYARQVLGSAVLEVDQQPQSIRLVSNRFPSIGEMNEGVGVIRLFASAETAPAAMGRHRLFYRNTHQPEMSVYLANALVPASNAVRIEAQQRSVGQHELRFDYLISFGAGSLWASLWWLAPVGAFLAFVTSHRFRKGVRETIE